MDCEIHVCRPTDEEAVVELALRALAPVFLALQASLGTEIFVRLHGDWRNYQAAFLRDTLADPETYAWVAEADRRVVGFASAKLYERHLGEITMLAVDPDAQGQGIGSALTGFATEWLARRGMRVAMVETGGDGGHGAARHMYTNAGYVAVPIVRYFKAL